MRSQDRALHLSASHGKNEENIMGLLMKLMERLLILPVPAALSLPVPCQVSWVLERRGTVSIVYHRTVPCEQEHSNDAFPQPRVEWGAPAPGHAVSHRRGVASMGVADREYLD